MGDFRTVYDSKFKRRYLVMGRYRSLLPVMALRLGLRNWLDKAMLFFQWRGKPVSSRLAEILKQVPSAIPGNIHSALLYDTSWYKDSLAIGYVRADENLYFLKICPTMHDAMFQQHQADFVARYFGNVFTTVPVIRQYQQCVVYPYISVKTVHSDRLMDIIIAANQRFLKECSVEKTVSEIIPRDIHFVLDQWNPEIAKAFKSWMSRYQDHSVPFVPVHGDLTPWNTGMADDKIVLFDYEQAGWQVPFYDYYHFVLQKPALDGKVHAITHLVTELPYQSLSLVIYLVDQIYQAIDKQKMGYHDNALQTMLKTTWLQQRLEQ